MKKMIAEVIGIFVLVLFGMGTAVLAGGKALSQLWVFIVAPIAGGILAAIGGKSVFETEDGNESIANKEV